MSNIILCDTREKGNQVILRYFQRKNIRYVETKLDAGDYMLKDDPTVIIDRKDSLDELLHNLTGRKKTRTGYLSEHDRLVREVERAHEAGCKSFIFLIAATKIKTIDDIKAWQSDYSRISGTTLLKIMGTFSEHHDCKFMFVPKRDMGKKIVEILLKK